MDGHSALSQSVKKALFRYENSKLIWKSNKKGKDAEDD
jgi:hypothetical protein